MIAFQNVSKFYNGHAILEDITLKVSPGEFVSVVGRSGAGKSTLIRLLIGEEKPTKGRVIFGAHEVSKLRPTELPHLRREIGIIFQDFKLLPTRTAYENVAFALEVGGRPQEEIREIVPQMLDLVGLYDKQHLFPKQLSGGMQQRVAIARAMIHRPAVVIADEPTGNLDPINTAEIINLLLKVNELGTTLVLASHNKEVINKIQKRVVTIDNGRVIKDEENGKYFL